MKAEWDEKIENLILSKDFENLTDEEKSLLKNIIDKNEYSEIQKFLRILNEQNKISAEPDFLKTEENIMSSFRKRKDENTKFENRIFLKRVPIYQVASIAAIFVIFFFVLGQKLGFQRANEQFANIDNPEAVQTKIDNSDISFFVDTAEINSKSRIAQKLGYSAKIGKQDFEKKTNSGKSLSESENLKRFMFVQF